MDSVFIHGLKAKTLIGIHQWERQVLREIEIDLDLAWDNHKAGDSDDINDALNYFAVSVDIQALCLASQYQLIESLAEAIWQHLSDEYNIKWARIKLMKPGAVKGVKSLGVIIERGTQS